MNKHVLCFSSKESTDEKQHKEREPRERDLKDKEINNLEPRKTRLSLSTLPAPAEKEEVPIKNEPVEEKIERRGRKR